MGDLSIPTIMKTILSSKTFWVQVMALASLAFPAVHAWVTANPVGFAAAWAGLNVLVRFATSGKVSLTGQDSGEGKVGSGMVPALVAACTAVGIGCSLPSCSASQVEAARGVPVKACYVDPGGATVCYSSTGGLEIRVERRGAK